MNPFDTNIRLPHTLSVSQLLNAAKDSIFESFEEFNVTEDGHNDGSTSKC